MSQEQQQLEAAIAALSAQRALLGNTLVDAALGPMRARLASLSTAQSLRYVTILFADVVGSTTLSQKLDPEDFNLVMDTTLTQCTTIIEAHQGKVMKYAGDSVLAVFGAEQAREDDAERAVLAGLELLEEGKRQGARVFQQHAHAGFHVRVGLHSGDVLLGGGLEGDSNIRGFSVNVAARMEQSAPVGGLLISHDTYSHVRGVFDVQVQSPLAVKGVDTPVTTYRVLRCKPRAFRVPTRGIEGVQTRMVGREGELGQLQSAFKDLYARPRFSTIHVVADAGLGKSRLLYEFENWAEAQVERFFFFQGRAHAGMQNQAYGLLRDIFDWRFQITDADSPQVRRQKFEQGFRAAGATESDAPLAQGGMHVFGHLIGVDYADSPYVSSIRADGQQCRNQAFHAAASWLVRLAHSEELPVLLLLDDLHWSDDESLEFLSYLRATHPDLALLIVAFSRPDRFTHPCAAWDEDSLHLVLEPLDAPGSTSLARELLKMLPKIPPVLEDVLISGAQGNPFYMEELVKMFVDEGALQTDTHGWSVHPEKFLSTRVPATLTGVLQSRLDRLSPRERQSLQQASVIGQKFWSQTLAALDGDAVASLPALLQHRLLIQKNQTQGDGPHEYAFAHHLLHQVSYDSLLKGPRRALHAKVAQWFASREDEGASDWWAVTAEHFAKAEDAFRACTFFCRAAEHAAARYAHGSALTYVDKAFEFLPQIVSGGDSPTQKELQHLRWNLLCVQERICDIEGRRDAQRAALDGLDELAQALHEHEMSYEVAWRRSHFALRTGDYAAMREAARLAMQLAGRTRNGHLVLKGQQRLAIAVTYLGEHRAGKSLALDGLSRARTLGARDLEALFLNALSVIADSQEDQIASLDLDQQDLAINREHGNRRNEAVSLNNLGNGWLRLGAHAQARQHLSEALELSRSLGDRAIEPNCHIALAVLALHEGAHEQALEHALAAVSLLAAQGNPDFEVIALCTLGHAYQACGNLDAAQFTFERAHYLAQRLDGGMLVDAWAGLARVAIAKSDATEALHHVNALLTRGDFEGSETPALVRLICYEVLRAVADPRASAVLDAAYVELQRISTALSDPSLRQSFLECIVEHRQTVAYWQDMHRQTTSEGPISRP